jgi:hypothetical protein
MHRGARAEQIDASFQQKDCKDPKETSPVGDEIKQENIYECRNTRTQPIVDY